MKQVKPIELYGGPGDGEVFSNIAPGCKIIEYVHQNGRAIYERQSDKKFIYAGLPASE